jgi:hypothetical protein
MIYAQCLLLRRLIYELYNINYHLRIRNYDQVFLFMYHNVLGMFYLPFKWDVLCTISVFLRPGTYWAPSLSPYFRDLKDFQYGTASIIMN